MQQLRKKCEDLQETLNSTIAMNIDLQRRDTTHAEDNRRLKESIAILKDKIKEVEILPKSSHLAARSHIPDTAVLSDHIASLDDGIIETNAKLKKTNEELALLKNHFDVLVNDFKQERSDREIICAEKEELQKQLVVVDYETVLLSNHISSLEDRLVELESNVKLEKTSADALVNDFKQGNVETEIIHADGAELTRQSNLLCEQIHESERRNMASLKDRIVELETNRELEKRQNEEKLALLRVQINTCEEDFKQERCDRERIHAEKEELKKQLDLVESQTDEPERDSLFLTEEQEKKESVCERSFIPPNGRIRCPQCMESFEADKEEQLLDHLDFHFEPVWMKRD